MLSTEAMEERHTAVNISQRLREISTEWKIADKVEAIVHDNAANMVLADTLLDEELDWGHVACVGHTLQLSINDSLKEATISKTVSIARKIVGHFNQPLNLVQDVPTRWNSTFLMLDRLVLLSNAVIAVLDGEKDTHIKAEAIRHAVGPSKGSCRSVEASADGHHRPQHGHQPFTLLRLSSGARSSQSASGSA